MASRMRYDTRRKSALQRRDGIDRIQRLHAQHEPERKCRLGAIRVSAKGIKQNFDSYTRADEEPRIYLELRIWPVVDAV
jgi:hypothetical protein